MMGPMLDEIAAAHEAHLTVAKVNIDENPVTVDTYSVMSVPTLTVFSTASPSRRSSEPSPSRHCYEN